MDQEPDTTGHPPSSPHFRGERRPRAARPADQPAREAVQRPHLQAPPEPELPTLFELPNLDPLAPFSPAPAVDETQHVVHNRHSGPPAGHVDPPSGNQIPRDQVPSEPEPGDSLEFAGTREESRFDEESGPKAEDFRPAADVKLSGSMQRADGSWGGRSALVILMLVMVTLAFLAGRSLTRLRDATSESMIADEPPQSLQGRDQVFADAEYESEMSVPSYIAEAETVPEVPTMGPIGIQTETQSGQTGSPTLTLGEPTTAIVESTSDNPFPGPIQTPPESVVTFRTDDSANVPAATIPTTPLADLPSGMNDRLKLEDGYVESNTPFSIEDFLSEEGLRMIDSLNQAKAQSAPASDIDLDAAFFQTPIEF
ncbi:MAG: hypothetical protein AAFX06_23600 [Planctomycetota bacterium]